VNRPGPGPGAVEWEECYGFLFYQPVCHACGWLGPLERVHRDDENGPRVRAKAARTLQRHWWSKHKRAAHDGGWRVV
jgi:hypothetical protein